MSKGWNRHKSRMTSFVALERFLLQSPAWQSLSPNARAAYVAIAHGYSGTNNGQVRMSSLSLAQQLHIGKASAHRALQTLLVTGFIEQVKAGGFNMKSGARAAEWRLTAFYCDTTGASASKAFMKWKPKIQNAVPLQTNCGSATDPFDRRIGKKLTGMGSIRNREAQKQGGSGSATGHHLEYNHMGTASQQGESAANQKASATPGSTDTGDTGFIILGTAAIQSLACLDATLPDELKSWMPVQRPLDRILPASLQSETVEKAA